MKLSREEREAVFEDLVTMALGVKSNRKARYRLLIAVVPRVGCAVLLRAEPALVSSVLVSAHCTLHPQFWTLHPAP